MAQYDTFARFYDAVNGEPEERIAHVLDALARFAPAAASVLELGCGTGAVLAGLGSGLELVGVDLSESMLEYARRRCPDARLLRADITTLDLGERFDAVVCVYDTLNHVTTLEGWRSVIRVASAHLVPGGLLVLDVNTLGRLRDLGEQAPWVHDFDGHTLVMSVDFTDEPLAAWDIRIFEDLGAETYRHHREVITELGVALDVLVEMLEDDFELLDLRDPDGRVATDDSTRALLSARRRP